MLEIIADSSFCQNSMIVADTLMLGIQGHPEFSTEYCRFRADYRYEKRLIDSAVHETAMQSLDEHSPHSRIILEWMRQFLLLPQTK